MVLIKDAVIKFIHKLCIAWIPILEKHIQDEYDRYNNSHTNSMTRKSMIEIYISEIEFTTENIYMNELCVGVYMNDKIIPVSNFINTLLNAIRYNNNAVNKFNKVIPEVIDDDEITTHIAYRERFLRFHSKDTFTLKGEPNSKIISKIDLLEKQISKLTGKDTFDNINSNISKINNYFDNFITSMDSKIIELNRTMNKNIKDANAYIKSSIEIYAEEMKEIKDCFSNINNHFAIKNTCIICMDNKSNNAEKWDCGHKVFCTECLNKLEICPLCRCSEIV